MTVALRLQDVHKRYGVNVALAGLSMEVPKGTICGFVGPNGAGKTTTFGIVGGLIRPNGGAIDVLGSGPFNPKTHAGRVTLMPQDAELNPHVPVQMLLSHYARLQGLSKAEAAKEATRVLDVVGLSDRAGQKAKQLSHGMRRRVSVAQALLGTPELVLLDEPTSGLDPELVVQMRDVFSSQRGKSTLVISSHILAELEATCDHVVFLEKGQQVRSGSMVELTGSGSMVRIRVVGGEPSQQAVAAAIPGVEAGWDGQVLTIKAPEGWDVTRINAAILPILLEAGLGVQEVRAGQSLEESYMAGRAPRG